MEVTEMEENEKINEIEMTEEKNEEKPEAVEAVDEDRTESKKGKAFGGGVILGAALGATLAALICVIVFGIVLQNYRKSVLNYYSSVTATDSGLTLGDDVASKMNTLKQVIDQYFLYDYDEEDMEEAIYDAMLDCLDDPYSVYYTPEEYQDMIESSEGTYCGIGVVVTKNTETGDVVVVYPYEDSPGEKAGLLADDILIAADGTELNGMDLDQAVTLIKGEEGTTVVLTIGRGDETFDVTVTREKIDIITVAYEMLEGDIGYIQVSQFDATTVDQFKEAIDALNDEGMKGLAVDIRSNPGGRLDAVVSMLDYILPEGLLVYTEDKYGNREEYTSDGSCHLSVPCAVLVNGNSASASEIFAGAMQDYDKAEIIGVQTFGKGIVQNVLGLTDGSAVKITVEDYYTPNGNNIHGIGITPDEVVELDSEAYLADGTDTQLEAALEYLAGQID